ncbi:MAG: hypothetical protein JNJ88_10570 [Planctomycetes bacterium]|nr:hypothetical protein [Planctomycetota bacterium]
MLSEPRAWLRSNSAMALALALGLAALYLAAATGRLFGDDTFFVKLVERGGTFTTHPLYLPSARLIRALTAFLGVRDPYTSLRVLSAVAGGAGAAFFFLAALSLGARRRTALLWAGLLATTPSYAFFASQAEVHALHMAAVTFGGFAVARLRQGVRPASLALVSSAAVLIAGTHQSGLQLLPGLYLLALWLARGAPWRMTVADLGALLAPLAAAAVAVCAHAAAVYGSPFAWRSYFGSTRDVLLSQMRAGLPAEFLLGYVATDWIAPAAGIVMCGCLALGAVVREHWRLGSIGLLLIAPHVVLFSFFHFEQRGAYLLPTLPVLLAAIAELWSLPRSATPMKMIVGFFGTGVAIALSAVAAAMGYDRVLREVPPPILVGAAGFCFVVGVATGAAVAGLRGLWIWGLWALLPLQCIGTALSLREYGRDRPVESWASGAKGLMEGPKKCYLLTDGFDEYQYADWVCGPGVVYTIPQIFEAAGGSVDGLEGLLRSKLTEGEQILLDERVRVALAPFPEMAAVLAELEQRFVLDPASGGSFRGFWLRIRQ